PYGNVSPMLMSCAQYGTAFSNGLHWSDKVDQGWSHNLRGVNGVFFDGSARWIGETEYPYDSPDGWKNTRFYEAHEPMQKWARKRLKY
ncbi:MAG: hypothetical protein KGZ25_09590, partial [Planctomycetes bacterium]|nr:hypothetical protein [Planctomycetota bacterium]